MAKHPTVDANSLVELYLPSAENLSLDRLDREHDRYSNEAAAMENRLRDHLNFTVSREPNTLTISCWIRDFDCGCCEGFDID